MDHTESKRTSVSTLILSLLLIISLNVMGLMAPAPSGQVDIAFVILRRISNFSLTPHVHNSARLPFTVRSQCILLFFHLGKDNRNESIGDHQRSL
ncbi:hypothetical protein C8R41DRAFT_811743 [Lentinula lateritia]|uniref:Secreted protein n=1 Tax=Lentinula lateritia TaxID=40482 RepID=A0ABQ8VUQ0_9AGAR|nr:hypothetical protein C8R41DRAFT_811743 [Lentinula lateritia]